MASYGSGVVTCIKPCRRVIFIHPVLADTLISQENPWVLSKSDGFRIVPGHDDRKCRPTESALYVMTFTGIDGGKNRNGLAVTSPFSVAAGRRLYTRPRARDNGDCYFGIKRFFSNRTHLTHNRAAPIAKRDPGACKCPPPPTGISESISPAK